MHHWKYIVINCKYSLVCCRNANSNSHFSKCPILLHLHYLFAQISKRLSHFKLAYFAVEIRDFSPCILFSFVTSINCSIKKRVQRYIKARRKKSQHQNNKSKLNAIFMVELKTFKWNSSHSKRNKKKKWETANQNDRNIKLRFEIQKKTHDSSPYIMDN